jgi:hypothetical protein
VQALFELWISTAATERERDTKAKRAEENMALWKMILA